MLSGLISDGNDQVPADELLVSVLLSKFYGVESGEEIWLMRLHSTPFAFTSNGPSPTFTIKVLLASSKRAVQAASLTSRPNVCCPPRDRQSRVTHCANHPLEQSLRVVPGLHVYRQCTVRLRDPTGALFDPWQ